MMSQDTHEVGTEQLNVDIPKGMKAELRDILWREKKPMKQWVREVIEQYIKAHKAGNPGVPLDKFIENPDYVACPTLLEADKFTGFDRLSEEELKDWSARAYRFHQACIHARSRRAAKEGFPL